MHHRSSITVPVVNAEEDADYDSGRDSGVDDDDHEKIGQKVMAAVRRGDQKEVPDTYCPMYFQQSIYLSTISHKKCVFFFSFLKA